MSDEGNEDFVIVLRSRSSSYPLVPVIIRIRRLLKIAWRGLGLRCVDIRAVPRPGKKTPGGPPLPAPDGAETQAEGNRPAEVEDAA